MGSVDINLGDTLPFFWEQFLELVGRDSATKATVDELRNMIRIAVTDSSKIQMVGMAEPLAFDQIYEPVPIIYGNREYPAAKVIEYKVNSLITGSPGQGKSTVLHWMYREIAREKESIPFLFTLRRPKTLTHLDFVISEIEKNGYAIKKLKVNHFWLLLDGYDEIPDEDRRQVSEQLLRFEATGHGHYILTCRNHYHVYDNRTNRMKLGDFGRDSAIRYIGNFARFCDVSLNPERLLRELDARGFASFYANPLLLTLVCLLKQDSPDVDLPTSGLALLTEVTNMLSFRWDWSKGRSRESKCQLGGHQRMSCLMNIAVAQASPVYSEVEALKLAQSSLLSLHRSDVDPQLLLYEMAQFFGFFVPSTPGKWEFVHRTIQDYLAARFIVESGRLRDVSSDFDFRAAQAACLTPDPDSTTEFMIRALRFGRNTVAFHECLYNLASFHASAVARALVAYYVERFPGSLKLEPPLEGIIRVVMSENWVRSAPDDLLTECARNALEKDGDEATCLIAACLCELKERQKVVSDQILQASLERFGEATAILVLMDDQSRIMKLSELSGRRVNATIT